MSQISTRKCLLWLAPLACLLIVGAELARAQGYQDYEDEQPVARSNQRVRRQQVGGRVQVPPQPGSGASPSPQPQVAQTIPNVNFQGGVQTGAMALSSALDAQPPSVGVSASNQARPPKVTSTGTAPQAPGVEDQPDSEVVRPMRKRKKQPRVRPTKPMYDDVDDDDERRDNRRDDENDDEYCDDGDDDEHGGFGHLFRPMRHMTRMMGSVMNQMQGMASNGFAGGNFPAGSNMAMAQSMSDSDGYSRLSSVVNNNGRTRGIVSETRNGRTQTRRIGGEDDAEAEDEQ